MIPLDEITRRFGQRILFHGPGEVVTYSEFARQVAIVESGTDVQHLQMEWTGSAFARLLAGLRTGKVICLGGEVPAGSLDPFLPSRPLLILPTGGTTGAPRHVVHSAKTLLDRYTMGEREETRILILYAPDHIAGLDAFFQAFYRGSSLVLPRSRDPESVAGTIEEQSVQILPATPGFLNFLLLSGSLAGRNLSSVKVIPHGAEPMPQILRKRIQDQFPNARLIQRFGMTELGALPVREDPEDPRALFLEATGHAWQVREGELQIRCPGRMLGTLEEGLVEDRDAWYRTGDLAELTPRGSIRIIGRREGMINVGGAKVLPERIEELLMELPMVLDAAVEGIPNPLTGQAVSARVVFSGSPDIMGLLRSMRQLVRSRGYTLASVPTRVVAVDSIPGTPVGKKARLRGKS